MRVCVRGCVWVCVLVLVTYILSTKINFWDVRTFILVLTTAKDCLRVETRLRAEVVRIGSGKGWGQVRVGQLDGVVRVI